MANINQVQVSGTTYDIEDAKSIRIKESVIASSTIKNIDNFLNNGMYYFSNIPQADTGCPENWTYFDLLVQGSANYGKMQILSRGASDYAYYRTYNSNSGGSWNDWHRIASYSDIAVKSVSVSGTTLTLEI